MNYGEKRNDMIIKLDTTIKELLAENFISVRTYNVCDSNNLYTVEEIKNFHDTNTDSFLRLRNCGRKSTLELRSVIKDIMPEVIKVDKDVEADEFDLVNQTIRQTFIDEYELFVNDPNVDIELISFFQEQIPNPSSLYNGIIYNTTKIFSEVSGNARLVYLFREQFVCFLNNIANQLEHKLPEGDEFAVNLLNVSLSLTDTFKKNFLADYCKYKLNKSRKSFLENEYSRLVRSSSRIVQKIAQSYFDSFYKLIPLLDLSKKKFVLRLGGKRKSAQDYYNNILIPFSQIFKNIIYGDVDEDTLTVSVNFPFLSNESIEWVKNFHKKNSYYPMFYIICEFLKKSNLRDYEMFCLRFGLNDTHILYSLAEIAQKFDLSKERVRQILSKQTLSKEPLAHSTFWKHYFVQDFILITDSSAVFKDICSSEKVLFTFESFAEICNIIFKFQFSDEFDCKFCSSPKHFSTIHTIFSRFNDLKKKRYFENTAYKVCDIISKQALEIPGIKDAIYSIVIPALNLKVSNGTLYFMKNFVDIEKEAFDILYQKGEPMRIEELVSLIKRNNVQFELNEDTIRNKIHRSKKILPIGKTSMCKLVHWRNVFGGNIRGLLRKIMNERETPVSLDELTSLVTDVFENTNRNSINSNLLSSDEFVYFANGYFGLRSKTYPPQFVEADPSKQRLSFNVRFKHFQEFVNTYQRIPYCSGADDEDSLYRWYYNVLKGNIDTTEEQQRMVNEFVDSNKELPQNGTEVRFKKLCQEYLDYVKTNYELPSHKEGTTLYNWLKKTLPNYLSYDDNRTLYFTKLIEELKTYGFYIC